MKLLPKFDRVLIQLDEIQKAGAKIILPPSVTKANTPARGRVVAVGPTVGVVDKKGKIIEHVFVGDHVIFAKHAGAEITLEDSTFWIIQDTDILADIVDDLIVIDDPITQPST